MPLTSDTSVTLAALDPLVADLDQIAQGASIAERLLLSWLEHMDAFDRCPNPDHLEKAVDSLTRLTAVRKSLIRLSCLIHTPFSPFVVPSSGGTPDPSAPPDSFSSTPAASAQTDVPQQPSAEIPNFHPSPFTFHPSNPSDSPNPHEITPTSMRYFMHYAKIDLPTFKDSDYYREYILPHSASKPKPDADPAREPNLTMPSTRDVRDVATLPFSQLRPTLDRVMTDLSAVPIPDSSIPSSSPSAPSNPSDPSAPFHRFDSS